MHSSSARAARDAYTRTVTHPLRRAGLLVGLLSLILVLPLVWYLGSPLLLNRVVDDGTSARSPSLQLLAEGRFGVVDAIHRAKGTAAIFQDADAARVLRLDDFGSPTARTCTCISPGTPPHGPAPSCTRMAPSRWAG
jgi:hypothetical protein